MRMNRLIAAAAALALVGAASTLTVGANTTGAGDTFSVDGVHSSVLFRVTHMDIAPFYGRFNKVEGSFVLDAEGGSSLEITIDVNSVDTNSSNRDEHLKSPDFFNAGQFPVAAFKSTSIKPDGDYYAVTGDLTIRGTTKAVSFTLVPTGEGDRGPRMGYRSGFEASLVIDRLDFGVEYMPEGLGKDVTLIIAVEGVRK